MLFIRLSFPPFSFFAIALTRAHTLAGIGLGGQRQGISSHPACTEGFTLPWSHPRNSFQYFTSPLPDLPRQPLHPRASGTTRRFLSSGTCAKVQSLTLLAQSPQVKLPTTLASNFPKLLARGTHVWRGSQLSPVIHLLWPARLLPTCFPVFGSHKRI